MTTDLKGSGFLGLSRIRKQRCRVSDCANKTRMALVVPCLDIEDDGGPGLAAVPVCGEHMEETLVSLVIKARA